MRIEMKLEGQKITEIRQMTEQEMADEYWDHGLPPTVIVLSGGTKLYPSQDGEGNGPGALFGKDKDGTTFNVC